MTKDDLKVAISAVWYSADVVARSLMRVAGRRPKPRFVVLYYHGVDDGTQPGFARHMEALARQATVVRASHTGELPDQTWCVGITFDDAFRTVLKNAIPELLSRSLQSTIFVPVEFIGRTPAWASEGPGLDREEVMTAEELQSLPELVELGSHTLRHPHLTTLAEPELREELVASRVKLEALLDRPVRLLAFPYGDYDERVVQVCREAGYERLFMIDPQLADPSGGDFVRGRVAVEPTDGPLTFYLKARGAYAWMTHASALKARVAGWRRR
jgi:peptidoglycan/xylan/chitin deacetylase (PgdA/CDA1 family)